MPLQLDHTIVPAYDKVKSAEFDAILQRVRDEGVVFGSGPRSRTDGEINHLHQGRGFYFECENGHVWEVITDTYVTCYGVTGGGVSRKEMMIRTAAALRGWLPPVHPGQILEEEFLRPLNITQYH